jgi:hypothetical protein
MELTIQKYNYSNLDFMKYVIFFLFEKNKLTHLTTIQKNIF